MAAQVWTPGTPWSEWAQRAYPQGWLAVGGPKGGELLQAGQRSLEVMAPTESLRASFFDGPIPLPGDVAFMRHTYRHERLSFPPALWWHVYVHQSLTTEEAQVALFYRLLANEAGVEDVRSRMGR